MENNEEYGRKLFSFFNVRTFKDHSLKIIFPPLGHELKCSGQITIVTCRKTGAVFKKKYYFPLRP